MLRILISSLFLGLLAACKMLPGNMRSEVKNSDVLDLIDESTVKFSRTAEGTGGDLSFRMKDKYNCRIQYWSDTLDGNPSPKAPMAIDCPNDGQKSEVQFALENLTPGASLNFRIMLWPRNTSFLANFAYEFAEGGDLARVQTSSLVVSRYVVPRNSNEIYTYQFPSVTNMKSIKDKLQEDLGKRLNTCVEGPGDTQLPYPRFKSVEDAQKRALHGLSKLSTDGFGQGIATVHPFFPTRLTQFFDDVDRQQNWKWSFDWEGRRGGFEVSPPGYLAALTLTDGNTTTDVRNRLLGNALPNIDVSSKPFVLTPSIQFVSDLSSFQLTVKSPDASKTLLRCDFPLKEASLAIPGNSYAKLPAGEYLVTLTLETTQIYARDGAEFPPWVISSQDWSSFKVNKKM